MDLLDLGDSMVVPLVIVLAVAVVAGSLLMVAVSLLLLAVFGGLANRTRAIKRNLDRPRDEIPPD